MLELHKNIWGLNKMLEIKYILIYYIYGITKSLVHFNLSKTE